MPAAHDDSMTLAGLLHDPEATTLEGLAPELRIGGRYVILGMLGVGGMGAVYKVRDCDLDEIVALKMLRKELVGKAAAEARFRQEIKLARRVSHANVVRTFEWGEQGAERFITMEYVEGRSLRTLIAETGPLEIPRAVTFARQICAGVAAAHHAGVYHRDLKPDNVLIRVRPTESVAISDFGIARAQLDGDSEGSGIVGTPAYMAPEVVQGRPHDATSDVYAVGAILYEMLAGERAWPGKEAIAVATARLREPPPDIRACRGGVPDLLCEVLRKALAQDPAHRYPTPEALDEALSDLGTIESGLSGTLGRRQARPTPPPDAWTLAVLPFKNNGVSEDLWLAQGLEEEIADALSMTRGLRVRPSAAAQRLGGLSPEVAGHELGVAVVVEGTVRRAGDELRIGIRVVSVTDGFVVFARRFHCRPDEALSIADAASEAISGALLVDARVAERAPAIDALAVENYLRARALLRHGFDLAELRRAVTLLEAAVLRSPDDPGVVALLGLAHARVAFAADDTFEASVEAALRHSERAVSLWPHQGEGWASLAQARWAAGDLPGAARALNRAVAVAPGLSWAQIRLGALLGEVGRLDEAVDRFHVALSLDPESASARFELMRSYALLGRWPDARDTLGTEEWSPSWADRFQRAFVANRIRLWAPEAIPAVEPPPPPTELPAESRLAWVYVQVCASLSPGSTLDPAVWAGLFAQAAVIGRANARRVAMQAQLGAELAMFIGDAPAGLERIQLGVTAGLVDRAWLERCPLLEPLRTHPDWESIRAAVVTRAQLIEQALDEGLQAA